MGYLKYILIIVSKSMTIATAINPIIGLRSANYIKYKRIGYNEAKQMYEEKIGIMKKDFAYLATKSESDMKKLIELIMDIQDAVWSKKLGIAQMEVMQEV